MLWDNTHIKIQPLYSKQNQAILVIPELVDIITCFNPLADPDLWISCSYIFMLFVWMPVNFQPSHCSWLKRCLLSPRISTRAVELEPGDEMNLQFLISSKHWEMFPSTFPFQASAATSWTTSSHMAVHPALLPALYVDNKSDIEETSQLYNANRWAPFSLPYCPGLSFPTISTSLHSIAKTHFCAF